MAAQRRERFTALGAYDVLSDPVWRNVYARLCQIGVNGGVPVKARVDLPCVETAAAATRDYLAAPELARYAQFLPASADEAAAVDYLPTLMAVPTIYRPLMALTATAHAANDFRLVTAAPPLTATPTPTPGS